MHVGVHQVPFKPSIRKGKIYQNISDIAMFFDVKFLVFKNIVVYMSLSVIYQIRTSFFWWTRSGC